MYLAESQGERAGDQAELLATLQPMALSCLGPGPVTVSMEKSEASEGGQMGLEQPRPCPFSEHLPSPGLNTFQAFPD